MASQDLLHQWVQQHRRLQNYMAALHELGLTPQEQYAYKHHLGNLSRGGVPHENGDISTFLSRVFTFGDRAFVLPTVWDNQIVNDQEAIRRSREVGMDKWPSYDSVDAAVARYNDMHQYMDRDMQGMRNANPVR